MVVVDVDVVLVERRLRSGDLMCPGCGAALAPWRHGRSPEIRGGLGSRLLVRPRRARCRERQVTHVLPLEALRPRRAAAAEVIGAIGAGLEIAAAGLGHRRPLPGRGHGAGWVRRF